MDYAQIMNIYIYLYIFLTVDGAHIRIINTENLSVYSNFNDQLKNNFLFYNRYTGRGPRDLQRPFFSIILNGKPIRDLTTIHRRNTKS